jgi:hypothetical protein
LPVPLAVATHRRARLDTRSRRRSHAEGCSMFSTAFILAA